MRVNFKRNVPDIEGDVGIQQQKRTSDQASNPDHPQELRETAIAGRRLQNAVALSGQRATIGAYRHRFLCFTAGYNGRQKIVLISNPRKHDGSVNGSMEVDTARGT